MTVAIPRELLEAAALLRATNPEVWQRFIGGMRLYAGAVAADMVRCDQALLPRAQGMALQASETVNLLATAHEQIDKLRGRNPYEHPRFKPA